MLTVHIRRQKHNIRPVHDRGNLGKVVGSNDSCTCKGALKPNSTCRWSTWSNYGVPRRAPLPIHAVHSLPTCRTSSSTFLSDQNSLCWGGASSFTMSYRGLWEYSFPPFDAGTKHVTSCVFDSRSCVRYCELAATEAYLEPPLAFQSPAWVADVLGAVAATLRAGSCCCRTPGYERCFMAS